MIIRKVFDTTIITLDQYPIRIYEVFDAVFYNNITDYIPATSLFEESKFNSAFSELRKLILERSNLGVGIKKSWLGVTVGSDVQKEFPKKRLNNTKYFIANLLHKYKGSDLSKCFHILDSNGIADVRKQIKNIPKYQIINTTKEDNYELAKIILKDRLLDVPELFDKRGSWTNFSYNRRYFADYLGCFLMYYDKLFQNSKPISSSI